MPGEETEEKTEEKTVKKETQEQRFLKVLEAAYTKGRAKDAEILHNALVEVIHEHNAAIYDILFVLDLIRFELMQAKYKEIMGVVKLTGKPPIKKTPTDK